MTTAAPSRQEKTFDGRLFEPTYPQDGPTGPERHVRLCPPTYRPPVYRSYFCECQPSRDLTIAQAERWLEDTTTDGLYCTLCLGER